MVRGSSADQRSAIRRLSASFIARGRTQITPRDRIQISKTSSLQSHRRMGVMKQDCNIACRTAGCDGGVARLNKQRKKPFARGPPNTKPELREMLTEAVRNTQLELKRPPQAKRDRSEKAA